MAHDEDDTVDHAKALEKGQQLKCKKITKWKQVQKGVEPNPGYFQALLTYNAILSVPVHVL